MKCSNIIHNTTQIRRNLVNFTTRQETNLFTSFSRTTRNQNFVREFVSFLHMFQTHSQRHKRFCCTSRTLEDYQWSFFEVCHKCFNHELLTNIFRNYAIRMIFFILKWYNLLPFDSSVCPIPIFAFEFNEHIGIKFFDFFSFYYFVDSNLLVFSEFLNLVITDLKDFTSRILFRNFRKKFISKSLRFKSKHLSLFTQRRFFTYQNYWLIFRNLVLDSTASLQNSPIELAQLRSLNRLIKFFFIEIGRNN